MSGADSSKTTETAGSHAAPSIAEYFRAHSAEVAALKEAGLDGLTDTLARWVSAQYVGAARRVAEEAGRAGLALPVLHWLAADIAALRKGDQSVARLRLERERLEIEREKSREWMKQPEVCNQECLGNLSEKEQARRFWEIFRMPSDKKPGLSLEGLTEIEREAKVL